MILTAIDKQLLKAIAELHEIPAGAYNIRRDGKGIARQSTANIEVQPRRDPSKPGLDIRIKPGTKNESVHIPVIVTRTGVHDLVYNSIEVGEGADVMVVAGCGIHNTGCAVSRHDGIHEIIVKQGARLRYVEKHYGEGSEEGQRILNPQTILIIEKEAHAEMELVQIKGVDHSCRVTRAEVHERGSVRLIEKVLTHGNQKVESEMKIILLGKESNAQVISRSVAQDTSRQVFRATLVGQQPCQGHVECDAIIMDQAQIGSSPELQAEHAEAELTHEAAIGKIAGDQIVKLMTLGLTEEEAVNTILSGFLL